MDFLALLKEEIAQFSELQSNKVTVKKQYIDSDSGSDEEKNYREQLEEIENDIENKKEDLEYYCKKWLREIQFESFNNYVTFNNKSLKLDLELLRSIIDETGYKSQTREGRVIVVFGAQEDLVSDLVFTFCIEDEFLKSVVYMTDSDAKDDDHKRQLMELCNSYNEETRIMKSYIDKDGTLMLERQDMLKGGVTRETISNIIGYVFAASIHLYTHNKEIFAIINKNNR